MPCENCVDLNSQIGDCPPFANRDDVVEALQNIWNQTCCVGVLSEDIDPTDPAQVLAAFSNAFPDGVTECTCGCLWMVYDNADEENPIFKQYQNCHGENDWLNSSAWCNDCGGDSCIGHLTTVGLDPSNSPVDAAAAVIEAFPEGLPCPSCETAIIFREDNVLCHSIDCGESWNCSSSSGGNSSMSYANTPAGSFFTACSGCNGGLPCTSSRTTLIRIFDISAEGDIGTGANESHLGVLLDCSVCPNGLRYDFIPSVSGWYRFTFNGLFQGNYGIGGNGACDNCQVGNSGGTIRLLDENNTIVYSQTIPNIGGSGKDFREVPIVTLVYLDSSKEYHMNITHNAIVGCCDAGCNPNYDIRGNFNVVNYAFDYVEP